MVLVDSEKVRILMFQKDLSVKEVATKSNVNIPTVSKVTRFDKHCRLKTVHRLAKGLDVEPAFIIKEIL